jgi:hypothetical protein
VHQHLRRGRDELELLGALAADLDERAPVVRADLLGLGEVVEDLLARHPGRQGPAAARGARVGRDRDARFLAGLAARRQQRLGLVEEPELVAVAPLARGPEALALQQPDVLAQLRDLDIALGEHRSQRLDVLRKCCALPHGAHRNTST